MSVTANSPQTDWDAIRAKLAAAKGKSYWRSLEELARTPEFMEAAAREFPRLGAPLTDFTSRNRRESSGNDIKETTRSDHGDVSRRAFLTVMGASLALAGLAGCGAPSPAEKIVPYLDAPADTQPGIPLTYATAMPMAGYGQGILVTAREGRPIKIEGNPTHPSSLGATDAITQASLLSLYDPDRSQEVLYRGFPSTWDEFLNAVTAQMETLTATGGTGLYLLTGAITSPTLTEQMHNLLQRYPNARWCQHEPVGRENASGGAEMAFGRDVQALYRFDRAEVIVSLDADFLLSMPGHVRYARDFSSKRTVRQNRLEMNRLYAVESTPTITGASADHRLALPPDAIEAVAREMATALGLTAWTAQTDTRTLPPLETRSQNWIASVVRDLRANDGKSLVVVGESQPPTLHALAHAINEALGNGGHTVVYIDPIAANPAAQSTTLAQLANDMHAGKAKMLVTLDSNPAYTAPADLEFTGAMAQVPFSVHLGEYEDETANLSLWHLPQSQYLETWSDIRAHDGTITIQQPLIAPLYATRTSHELLSVLNGRLDRSNHDILRDRWQSTYNSQVAAQHSAATMQSVSNTTASNTRSTAFRAARTADQSAIESIDDFTLYWRTLLNDGIVPNTAATPLSIQPAPNAQRPTPNASIPTHTPDTHEYPRTPNASTLNAQRLPLSLVFTPDPTLWDGRYNNNGWLQELPKPVTKLTWENAACISPRTAQSLDLADGELVSLRYRGRQIEAPVLVVPGHAEETVSISLGYGRTRAGSVGTSAGFNAYALRTSDALWGGTGLELTKTGRHTTLAITHSHQTMEGRDIIRSATLTEYRRSPNFVHAHQTEPERPASLYPEYAYPEYAWAMSIDLTRCIGCNACIVACQAENNIAVVGKDQVLRGREMHWLRIDRYYEGDDLDHPDRTLFMPVPCMHCEQAPCELVCPPGATLHNRDGLNQMVYNRCIGTRYCSNNCPYKVRRFNFLQYADLSPLKQLMRNPEVTVRSRGVMEKCTYCVQRIENAKIHADIENRPVRDGEVVPACAQACPTSTITFGNLADSNSKVAQTKQEAHDYGLLSELNTRPRTTYLGHVSNPSEAK